MRIVRAEHARFALPMVAAVQTARGRHALREGLLIRITTADGLVGHGEATPLPTHGTETLLACEETVRRSTGMAAGNTFGSVAEIVAWLDGTIGDTHPAARCGLELALLDLLGQERGLPIAGLLAHEVHASIRISALLVAPTASALALEAEQRAREGFATLKLKVGAGSLADDLTRVDIVKRAAGEHTELRLDANGSWSLEAARNALSEICARHRVALCEQPVASLRDLLALRPAPCPIAADELLADPADATSVVDLRAADAVVLKPMVLGGLTRALDLARRAVHAGLQVIVTTTLDGAVARAGALHLAAACPTRPAPCGLATGFLFERDLAPELIHCVRGLAATPTAPGLGIKPDAALNWECGS